jgi:hypothetical protein
MAPAPKKKNESQKKTPRKKASKMKALDVSTVGLPGNRPAPVTPVSVVGFVEEYKALAGEYSTVFLKNLKSQQHVHHLTRLLTEKNALYKEGWLRKALDPDAIGNFHDSEKGKILLLSSSLCGRTKRAKLIAQAWGKSEQSIRNTWEPALKAALMSKPSSSEI